MRRRKTQEELDQSLAVTVDGALRSMLPRGEKRSRFSLYQLQKHWNEVVGAVNARHCQPARLDKSVLYVDVDGSVWASELSMLKQEILGRIQGLLTDKEVRDIRFHTGTVHRRPVQAAAPPSRRELPPLTDEEKETVRQNLPPLGNEALRPRIFEAACRRAQLEKMYRAGQLRKCPRCGAFLDRKESVCPACEQEYRVHQERALWRIIRRRPWVRRAEEVGSFVPCDDITFNMVKKDVDAYFFERVRNGVSTPEEDRIAVQLKCHRPADLIPEKEQGDVLAYLKGKNRKNVRTSGNRVFHPKQ